MTDEQFDDLSKDALAFDAGYPSVATWSRIRPARWKWLPTVPEILASGAVAALALFCVGVRSSRISVAAPQPNPFIEKAMQETPSATLASVSRIAAATLWNN